MSLLHENTPSYPQIFQSDRNIMLSGGGTHTWTSTGSTGTWKWSGDIYLNWFAGRLHGTAKFNKIAANTSGLAIPIGSVAYVVIDPNVYAKVLTVVVADGATIQHSENMFVLAMHSDLGYGANPLSLRNGIVIPSGGTWISSGGTTATGVSMAKSGTIWNCAHNLNSSLLSITVFDSSNYQVFPESIQIIDDNNVRIIFSGSGITGRACIIKGIPAI